ncbi:SMP-30/gluconolactonase/LRE family protein [candidate division KSB1 bacterium]|nr:SMP-30/gluconolactonase/LRE family protein [candidate division KSB1 bacterium]
MKNYYFIIALFVFAVVLTCGKKQDSQTRAADQQIKLTQQWATDTLLTTCESVLYDPDQDVLYVSCINGQPLEKNGKGFIARVNMDGTINDLEWATGLNAPKGSGIWNGKFYVTDIDELVEIDLATGEIDNRYPAANATFLNDIAVDKSGNVYMSDMSETNNVIYIFSNGELKMWLQDPQIVSPNGVFVDGNKLIVGTSKATLSAVDLADKSITKIADTGFGIDGVQADGNGNYFVSDWSGMTSVVTSGGKIQVLLNTTEKKINSADIEYIPARKMLLTPTFFDNRVIAYLVE